MTGTFIFVFLFMLSTDKKTQFSKDKVINCFIIASAYVASRLMAGGTLITGMNISHYKEYTSDGDGHSKGDVEGCDMKYM